MYRRSYYRGRGGKYSNETICVNAQATEDIAAGQPIGGGPLVIVTSTDVLGNRKVKNFTLKFNGNLTDDTIIGILAYVPEGTNMSTPSVGAATQSLYEPNQNVIATFILPPSCVRNPQGQIITATGPTTVTVSNRLARNLSTGDSIQLYLTTPNGLTANEDDPAVICGTVNYSIKY